MQMADVVAEPLHPIATPIRFKLIAELHQRRCQPEGDAADGVFLGLAALPPVCMAPCRRLGKLRETPPATLCVALRGFPPLQLYA